MNKYILKWWITNTPEHMHKFKKKDKEETYWKYQGTSPCCLQLFLFELATFHADDAYQVSTKKM